ncbi:16S rRNA (guanine(966)-N(2))-methyltransferase RsmD [Bacillus sp. PS06]|uniref:16S rRNA (guanine(966)-N(2))-methyltransferase RsmD n=1 Tax=Bacillus sp. PS06 TaxID=2764176 RepID=UPI0017877664|nr:16S rRNA (guanine(966)-N(2))-methyltransferase RsmD [Bacillus sp. PS06]MBD8068412.1 16S rRNA (guanine(966)-N(2))-methyltransferase RsmD [Bacillus sp. PS06]
MRVISGTCKGRPLKAVPGTSTRPTTDKVKEAIFNMIGPYFDEGIALDLFGGSGGLGIEALSRGIDKAIFVDKEFKAIQTIKENVANCDFSDRVEVYRNDAARALKALIKRNVQFDYIFLDPPYNHHQLEALIMMIHDHQLLAEDGYIIAEHDHQVELSDTLGSLSRKKFEKYGITAISVFGFQSVVEGSNTND